MTNTQTTPQVFGRAIQARPIVFNVPAPTKPEVVADTEETALKVTAVACFLLTGGAFAVLIYTVIVIFARVASMVTLPAVMGGFS